MTLRLSLDTFPSRILAIVATLGISVWLVFLVLSDFLVGALTDDRIAITHDATPAAFITAPFTDDRIGVNPDVLAKATFYLPNSPRLHLRLAEFETPYFKDNGNFAEYHARRAVELSPNDYKPLLALASAQEYKENLPAAEQSLHAALRLAPGNLEAHWRLGVVLVQRRQIAESLAEFRTAASGNPAYLRAALDLVWDASGEDATAVTAISPDHKLALATFLLAKSRVPESAASFRQVARNDLLADRTSSEYLNTLIKAGHVELAHELWRGLIGPSPATSEQDSNLVWNGGFDSDILLDFAQFDWSIQPSNYAQISIDAQGGRRALRIDYLGRETTRLEDEIKQVLLVRPKARYRLSYNVKTEDLVAPEGPRVALSSNAGAAGWTVAAAPTASGSSNWQPQTIEFAAPAQTLNLTIRQRPRYSYEEPTSGTVWFDDFELQEIR